MTKTKEEFLDSLLGRRRDLAEALLDGTPNQDLLDKGYSPVILAEMAQLIRRRFDPEFRWSLEVEREVVDYSTGEDDKVIGAKTGVKKKHITQLMSNEPLVGGCCEG